MVFLMNIENVIEIFLFWPDYGVIIELSKDRPAAAPKHYNFWGKKSCVSRCILELFRVCTYFFDLIIGQVVFKHTCGVFRGQKV